MGHRAAGALLLGADRVPDQLRPRGQLTSWAMEIPVRTIYELNPLVTLRRVLPERPLRPRFPPLGDLAYVTAWALALLGLGLWVFRQLDRRLAEEL